MSEVRGLSKSQQAHAWIKKRITEREFTPGYRLVLEPIARELGMSPVPVREAIRQLEAEGLVTFERNVGAHVAMVDDTLYRATMHTLAIIEGAATALAAPYVATGDIAAARALNDDMARLLEAFDPQGFTRMNRQFHTCLFNRCPNLHLLGLVNSEWDRLDYFRASTFTFIPERSRRSVREHEQLLQLIESAAPAETIEKVVRDHRLETLEVYLKQAQS
jgi:DNA-binding GntR family transcriptional regulator